MFVEWIYMFVALIACHVESAKILGVFPFASKSHSILGQALFTALAKQGHEVTYISPFPLKKPPKNYRDIPLTDERIVEVFQAEMDKSFEANEKSPLFVMRDWFKDCALMNEYTLNDPAVQKLLNSKTEKFDLVIIELLMNEALLGFGAHFNAPIIGLSTFGQVAYVNHMMHSPAPMSLIPHPFLSFTDRMTYSERLQNVFFSTLENLMSHFFHFPLQEDIYNRHFKAKKPSLLHMIKHGVSMVLLNNHFTLNYPQALLPNMIEIGGFHVKIETNPLPEDIQKFIDESKHGVVYFSLGSNLKPSKMAAEKKEAIIEALSKIKERVIWKWDDDSIVVDKNKFLVRKWLPQDDILAHPKVKLFVTHGGLLSCTESIYRGIPIVGIPIFGDQLMNMARASTLGWGVYVNYQNLTEPSLSWALNEVLSQEKYHQNVITVSKRLQDQPQTPMEKAISSVEYVIRHQGAYFMQSSGQHLNLIEYHNLDVFATFAAVLFLVIMIAIIIIKTISNLSYKTKKAKSTSDKKKKLK